MARINAAFDIASLASRNAANVITHMLIANSPFIGAGFDDAGIAACNTADIRDGSGIFRGEEVRDGGFGIELSQVNTVVFGGGVDMAAVDGACDAALIAACDPSRQVAAADHAVCTTAGNYAGELIGSRDPTHTVAAGDISGAMTVGKIAGIGSGQHGKARVGVSGLGNSGQS